MKKLIVIISLICFSANAQNINIQSNTNIYGFNPYYSPYGNVNYNYGYNGNRELILADAITSFFRFKLRQKRFNKCCNKKRRRKNNCTTFRNNGSVQLHTCQRRR